MKYFFLTEGWSYNRVWQTGGLWDAITWRRPPHISCLRIGIEENGEVLWLYEVEDAVLMIEVKPSTPAAKKNSSVGQVVLKRLIDSTQVIDALVGAKKVVNENS
ncbi:hypothetical protein A5482_005655 [Cyanobacterium sp. IPPAS B-1200]|uniref:hypothetical protein n=1 Tax=Cyanobacterium sp. IPPAS B-1200 TaxID=1562720 RepID=UPI0008527B4F|nr:hypothetical protein [Cyanobacterium sp. IPPAS B-1200]OEJ78775.1 hypothetical protein A5482_02590 [Cyanobacterium sp. IPPAS B-1200]